MKHMGLTSTTAPRRMWGIGTLIGAALGRGRGAPAPGEAKPARRAGRFLSDTGGSVAVLASVVLPVVLGGFALGVETSYWYLSQRKLQHAADLSVQAAAARKRAGDTLTDITTAAANIASSSGFVLSRGTIVVNDPPKSGIDLNNPNSIEVLLTEQRPRWFTAVFKSGPVTLKARAVSRITGGATACVLALSPSAGGAITVSGSTIVSLVNCHVMSNSVQPNAFLMSGSMAAMNTGCVYTVGQAVVTPGLTLTTCASVRINSPRARDPYRDVAEPAVVGACENSRLGKPNTPTIVTPTVNHPSGMKSMRFCSGLDVKGQVTFMPGLYIIEGGDFDFNGGNRLDPDLATVNGTGVIFYLRGISRLRLNGNVTLNISAPTTGPYAGILVFGNRTTSGVTHEVNGTIGSILQGAIYAPASLISYAGNSATLNGCTQLIGDRVTMIGNATLRSACAPLGGKTILANESLTLIE